MFSLLATAGTTDSSGETLTDQAVSKVNAFQRFWDGIDWDRHFGCLYPKKFISDFFDRPFLDSSPCGKISD